MQRWINKVHAGLDGAVGNTIRNEKAYDCCMYPCSSWNLYPIVENNKGNYNSFPPVTTPNSPLDANSILGIENSPNMTVTNNGHTIEGPSHSCCSLCMVSNLGRHLVVHPLLLSCVKTVIWLQYLAVYTCKDFFVCYFVPVFLSPTEESVPETADNEEVERTPETVSPVSHSLLITLHTLDFTLVRTYVTVYCCCKLISPLYS